MKCNKKHILKTFRKPNDLKTVSHIFTLLSVESILENISIVTLSFEENKSDHSFVFPLHRVNVARNDLPWEFMVDHVPSILFFPRYR